MIRLVFFISLLICSISFAEQKETKYVEVTNFDRSVSDVFDTSVNLESLDEDIHFTLNDQNYPLITKSTAYTNHGRIDFDLSRMFDVEKLVDINNKSQQVWREFVGSCGGGSQLQSIKNYIDNESCTSEKLKLLAFKSEVEAYIDSNAFKPFQFESVLKCGPLKGRVESTGDCNFRPTWSELSEWMKSFPHDTPVSRVSNLAKHFKMRDEIFNDLMFPNIHPFLFQVVAEIMADGFPYPYVDKEQALFGVIKSAKGISGSRHYRPGLWEGVAPKTSERNVERDLIDLARSSVDTDSIVNINEYIDAITVGSKTLNKKWMNGFFEKTLRSFRAEILFYNLSLVGTYESKWGLYPAETGDLILITALTPKANLNPYDYRYEYRHKYYSTYSRMTLFNSLAQVQDPGGVFFAQDQIGNRTFLIDRLQNIGAWRKLRHFE